MRYAYRPEELREMGIVCEDDSPVIDRTVRFYGPPGRIYLAKLCRIDAYCVVSSGSTGYVKIGRRVYVGPYCNLHGGRGIELRDYSGLAPRCSLYSETEDYVDGHLLGPMMPAGTTRTTGGPVVFETDSHAGTGATVMPSVSIGAGAVITSGSLITRDVPSYHLADGKKSVPGNRAVRSAELLRSVESEDGPPWNPYPR